MTEETIFIAALEFKTPAEQAAYLNQACGSDTALRARIVELLALQERAGSFLEHPASEQSTITAGQREPSLQDPRHSATPRPHEKGAKIGPYKLLQKIGEGGMGVVYMAEQEKPVRRRVAIKIIKPGMDSAQVIARFEAERQALAMMDHPGIAHVYDAGTTENGRPYFAMELVQGVPITQYCDQKNLTPKERLALFVPVCKAIQHAHTKGIIHRDIKPTNILVMTSDGKPVPKIIDFGVAKALHQTLTEKTMFTQFGGMMGTLQYMSPEQTELDVVGTDARCDIYSLGVLLYELLTGSTPLDAKKLKEVGYAEMLRTIREQEPPKPSTRLSLSGQELAALSAHRGTAPQKLARLVTGDLDWIVMKCLEKDRARRYETANGLARDVERYLADEAVEACPPSIAYRTRKFIRRHKAGATAAALVGLALFLGVIGTAVGFVRARAALGVAQQERITAELERNGARREADRATAAEKLATQRQQEAEHQAARAVAARDFLTDILSSANPNKAGGRDVKLADLLDAASAQIDEKFRGQPELEIDARYALATSYNWLGVGDEALTHLRKAYLLALELPRSQSEAAIVKIVPDLGRTLAAFGQYDEALRITRQSYDIANRIGGPASHSTNNHLLTLARILEKQGKNSDAEDLYRKQLQWAQDHPGQLAPADHSTVLNNLAVMLQKQGKLAEAEALQRQADAIAKGGPSDPDDAGWRTGINLAYFLMEHEKYGEAREIYKQLIPDLRKKLGDADSEVVNAMYEYARVLLQTGDYQELLSVRRQMADPGSRGSVKDAALANALYNLADAYSLAGQETQASKVAADALSLMRRSGLNAGIVRQAWRIAELRAGIGAPSAWKNASLRAQLWCALDQFLSDNPPPNDDLDDVQWPSLSCKLQRWDAAASGAPHLVLVAQGALIDMQALRDLESGEYLLSMDAPRAHRSPMQTTAWLTLAPWEAALYAVQKSDAYFGFPSDWRELKLLPPAAHRGYSGLALSSILSRDAGPGGRETNFAVVATSTLHLPAGKYRLVVSSDDGVRVDLDGRRVIDSWVDRLRRYLKSSDFADSTVGWKLTKGAKDGQYQAESQAHRHHLAMS